MYIKIIIHVLIVSVINWLFIIVPYTSTHIQQHPTVMSQDTNDNSTSVLKNSIITTNSLTQQTFGINVMTAVILIGNGLGLLLLKIICKLMICDMITNVQKCYKKIINDAFFYEIVCERNEGIIKCDRHEILIFTASNVAAHRVRGMGSYIKDDGIESISDLHLALKLCNKLIIEIKKFDAALNVDNEYNNINYIVVENLTLSIKASIHAYDEIKCGILSSIDELESGRSTSNVLLIHGKLLCTTLSGSTVLCKSSSINSRSDNIEIFANELNILYYDMSKKLKYTNDKHDVIISKITFIHKDTSDRIVDNDLNFITETLEESILETHSEKNNTQTKSPNHNYDNTIVNNNAYNEALVCSNSNTFIEICKNNGFIPSDSDDKYNDYEQTENELIAQYKYNWKFNSNFNNGFDGYYSRINKLENILAQNCVNLFDEMSSSGVLLSKLVCGNVLCENENDELCSILQSIDRDRLVLVNKSLEIYEYLKYNSTIRLICLINEYNKCFGQIVNDNSGSSSKIHVHSDELLEDIFTGNGSNKYNDNYNNDIIYDIISVKNYDDKGLMDHTLNENDINGNIIRIYHKLNGQGDMVKLMLNDKEHKINKKLMDLNNNMKSNHSVCINNLLYTTTETPTLSYTTTSISVYTNKETPIAKEIKDFVFTVLLIAFVLGIIFFIINMIENGNGKDYNLCTILIDIIIVKIVTDVLENGMKQQTEQKLNNKNAMTQMKGAPERILELCERYLYNEKIKDLNDEIRTTILGSRAERVLELTELILHNNIYDHSQHTEMAKCYQPQQQQQHNYYSQYIEMAKRSPIVTTSKTSSIYFGALTTPNEIVKKYRTYQSYNKCDKLFERLELEICISAALGQDYKTFDEYEDIDFMNKFNEFNPIFGIIFIDENNNDNNNIKLLAKSIEYIIKKSIETDNKSMLKVLWKRLLVIAEQVHDKVNELQEPFKESLLNNIETLKKGILDFDNKYKCEGSFSGDLNKPIDAMAKLNKFVRECDIIIRKYELYSSGETLFGLLLITICRLEAEICSECIINNVELIIEEKVNVSNILSQLDYENELIYCNKCTETKSGYKGIQNEDYSLEKKILYEYITMITTYANGPSIYYNLALNPNNNIYRNTYNEFIGSFSGSLFEYNNGNCANIEYDLTIDSKISKSIDYGNDRINNTINNTNYCVEDGDKINLNGIANDTNDDNNINNTTEYYQLNKIITLSSILCIITLMNVFYYSLYFGMFWTKCLLEIHCQVIKLRFCGSYLSQLYTLAVVYSNIIKTRQISLKFVLNMILALIIFGVLCRNIVIKNLLISLNINIPIVLIVYVLNCIMTGIKNAISSNNNNDKDNIKLQKLYQNQPLTIPHELFEIYGSQFEEMYCKYELRKEYKKQVKARELWTARLQSQIETGTPHMVYKDACNNKSNKKILGCIKSSNLCTEIIENMIPIGNHKNNKYIVTKSLIFVEYNKLNKLYVIIQIIIISYFICNPSIGTTESQIALNGEYNVKNNNNEMMSNELINPRLFVVYRDGNCYELNCYEILKNKFTECESKLNIYDKEMNRNCSSLRHMSEIFCYFSDMWNECELYNERNDKGFISRLSLLQTLNENLKVLKLNEEIIINIQTNEFITNIINNLLYLIGFELSSNYTNDNDNGYSLQQLQSNIFIDGGICYVLDSLDVTNKQIDVVKSFEKIHETISFVHKMVYLLGNNIINQLNINFVSNYYGIIVVVLQYYKI